MNNHKDILEHISKVYMRGAIEHLAEGEMTYDDLSYAMMFLASLRGAAKKSDKGDICWYSD